LICRFCSQWNPDEALRCSFCANLARATEDATASGRVSKVQARVTASSAPVVRGAGPEPDFARDLRRADWVWQIVVAVGAGLVGLLYLLGRCG
jgi:hypothetical protein